MDELNKNDKVLFKHDYMSIRDKGGYIYVHEDKMDGTQVAILIYRTDESPGILGRFEVCPPHGPEPQLSSVTGSYDKKGIKLIELAISEVKEETGFEVTAEEMAYLGIVRPSKGTDTIVYLYAVDVTGKQQKEAAGDGTVLEASAYTEWVSTEQAITSKDPLLSTMIARALIADLSIAIVTD